MALLRFFTREDCFLIACEKRPADLRQNCPVLVPRRLRNVSTEPELASNIAGLLVHVKGDDGGQRTHSVKDRQLGSANCCRPGERTLEIPLPESQPDQFIVLASFCTIGQGTHISHRARLILDLCGKNQNSAACAIVAGTSRGVPRPFVPRPHLPPQPPVATSNRAGWQSHYSLITIHESRNF
jgi:hypothetical protein